MSEQNGTDRYAAAKKLILAKLKADLPHSLYYHGLHHILDVLEAAERLGKLEKITDHEMELLRLAALFHDSGYTISNNDHEVKGSDIAREALPQFGYSAGEIESICGMIMATKYPQEPKNHLEEILCDADLDYLGRDDFFEIGSTLYKELHEKGSLSGEEEWNKLQESFLASHSYFTRSANELRKAKKQAHLSRIRSVLY
jgi:uncharacterized protein